MSEKIQVARTSAILGGTLALLKLAIGFLTGSLALISEGVHSSLDFGVTLVTWLSVKTADVPADEKHHYGHGKVENLSAFGQAILLVMTGFWILRASYIHLSAHERPDVNPGWWAAIPLVAAIFMPYFAVVIANVSTDPRRGEAQAPGNILPMAPPPPAGRDERQENT